jgi:RNA polymerase sigma-70 factor (ECF subfamily)
MEGAGELDLRELLNRAACGDEEAFKTAYRAYFPKLHGFIKHSIHDPHAVLEIISETFLVAKSKADTFDRQRAKPSTWLCGIAENKIRDYWRKQGRQPSFSTDEDAIADIPSGDAPVMDQLEHEERMKHLNACRQELPEPHRQALHLFYAHDASLQEIAEVQQCPIGTVRSRMHHARNKLAACVRARMGLDGNPSDNSRGGA